MACTVSLVVDLRDAIRFLNDDTVNDIIAGAVSEEEAVEMAVSLVKVRLIETPNAADN